MFLIRQFSLFLIPIISGQRQAGQIKKHVMGLWLWFFRFSVSRILAHFIFFLQHYKADYQLKSCFGFQYLEHEIQTPLNYKSQSFSEPFNFSLEHWNQDGLVTDQKLKVQVSGNPHSVK